MNHPLVKVCFRYYFEEIHDIRIVGNTQNTGNWIVEKSLPLIYADGCYKGEILLPYGTKLEYKYIKYSENVIWEAFQNRKLHCIYTVIHVKDHFNTGISNISYQPYSSKPHHYEKLPEIHDNIHFSLSDSIIFANFNLPIRVSLNPLYGDDNYQEQWLIEMNKGIWFPVLYDLTLEKKIDILWVGWPGIILDNEEDQKSLTDFLLTKYRCYPIFLSETLLHDFNDFCNNILCPIFNSIIHTNAKDIPQHSIEQWECYKNVNSVFAEAIMTNYTSQLIWINEYALMLTPNFVSRRIHELLNIGFYMHSPFPSAEIFRTLPQRESILHSILACDLVSFHSYDYASNFLGACRLLIGIEHHFSKEGYLLIEYFGRDIMLRVGEISIEAEGIHEKMLLPEFKNLKSSFQQKYPDTRILLGIDVMHNLSGLTIKLQAFKEFITRFNTNIVLLQYLTSPKIITGKETEDTLKCILTLQSEINDITGRKAVELIFEDLNQIQRYALMSESFAYFNCCLKDTTCLVAYEYLIVNQTSHKPVIISEAAGLSKSLRSLIKINPYKSNSIVKALLNLQEEHNFTCRDHDIQWILANNMQKWATKFLSDLKKAQKNPKLMQYMKHGMGDKMKLVALRKHFAKLDLESLLITYKRARFRAMFLDNEGTLIDYLKLENLKSTPSKKLLECLGDLSRDPQNVIFIITGREKKVLEGVYNLPHLGLAAEYGSFIKWSPNQSWECSIQINELWKDIALHIIEAYVLRTDGSYVEEKECSVVFQYKNSDYEYGSWQAKELITQLDLLLQPYIEECEVVEGTGYVEVKPRNINKGVTIENIMEECHKGGIEFDFVLAIGDDYSDEEMFKALKQLYINKSNVLSKNSRCFSCTLGRKPTEADYYLNDSSEILQYLEALRNWTKRDPEAFANWNSTMHIVDILKSKRSVSLDTDSEL